MHGCIKKQGHHLRVHGGREEEEEGARKSVQEPDSTSSLQPGSFPREGWGSLLDSKGELNRAGSPSAFGWVHRRGPRPQPRVPLEPQEAMRKPAFSVSMPAREQDSL